MKCPNASVEKMSRRCDNCGKELGWPRYVVSIHWSDVGTETGFEFEEDLYFEVCSVRCGIELLAKCLKDEGPLDGETLNKADKVEIWRE